MLGALISWRYISYLQKSLRNLSAYFSVRFLCENIYYSKVFAKSNSLLKLSMGYRGIRDFEKFAIQFFKCIYGDNVIEYILQFNQGFKLNTENPEYTQKDFLLLLEALSLQPFPQLFTETRGNGQKLFRTKLLHIKQINSTRNIIKFTSFINPRSKTGKSSIK